MWKVTCEKQSTQVEHHPNMMLLLYVETHLNLLPKPLVGHADRHL